MEVEEPVMKPDALEIFNANPNYRFRWCLEKKVANGRKSDWKVVDRHHPDFEGMRVNVDHSPDQTYIKYMDVILCCMRRETAAKKKALLAEKVKKRTEGVGKKFERGVKKLSKALGGGRQEALRAMDKIEKEE
jgi:hypothetical protein